MMLLDRYRSARDSLLGGIERLEEYLLGSSQKAEFEEHEFLTDLHKIATERTNTELSNSCAIENVQEVYHRHLSNTVNELGILVTGREISND